MFEVGFTEIVLIFGIALLVLGPKKLPKLAADTRKGMRPSFSHAAPPELGRRLFDYVLETARRRLPGRVATGEFGADMKVSLTNDGPVTFCLRVSAGQPNG